MNLLILENNSLIQADIKFLPVNSIDWWFLFERSRIHL